MPLNPFALSAALTPTIISTWFSHVSCDRPRRFLLVQTNSAQLLPRKSQDKKPTTNLSYDEGIRLMREFLAYSAKYPVEDLQAFTRQRVPSPHWVRTESISIPQEHLSSAAANIIDQLGPKGVSRVGGSEWWQWRGPSGDLKGEWVEMKRDYNERKQANTKCRRIILYVHGGAYSFGSIDTHRYQLQRHARKLKGRVFAR
jgi:acetyl esterase/lipase